MDRLAYPPAQSVATTVEQHFRRHIERTGLKSEVPDAPTIERIINAAFWASLRREEGREPTISLAYLPPEAAGTALFVERPLPLDPANLTKLSPAVERPGIHPAALFCRGSDRARLARDQAPARRTRGQIRERRGARRRCDQDRRRRGDPG